MTEVTPGIYWIKMPIGMADSTLEHVNIYLIEGNSGYLLVDTGWNTKESFDTLRKNLDEIGVDIKDISRILVTHVHPDHYGMAGRIRQISGAPIMLHEIEKGFYFFYFGFGSPCYFLRLGLDVLSDLNLRKEKLARPLINLFPSS